VIEVEVQLGSDQGEFVLILSGMTAGRLTLELTRDELLLLLGAVADLAMVAGAISPQLAAKLHLPQDRAGIPG
jgi:hypothetical protein